ncbi:MAG: aminopeptidase [Solirubrobacteraceae bacterium]|jgi:aminopeptidase
MADLDNARVQALAKLAVEVGANVAEGQTVLVSATAADAPLVHEVVRAAYRRGAHRVEVRWEDPVVRLIRLEEADDAAIGQIPPWAHELPTHLGALHGAAISLVGEPAPGLLDHIDAERLGRDAVFIPEWGQAIAERKINWTVIPSPTPGWAASIHPELDGDAALELLWREIDRVCRLDEPDPVAAWQARSADLRASAERLNLAELDSLHFEGEGTDLHIGLLPGVRWQSALFETVWGRRHMPNLPTEEVFTSPDPERTEGIVRSTKPLLVDGRAVSGLRMRFEAGRAVEIDADSGAELMREVAARDENAARLGEVALVDGSGRIGALDTIFRHTLLDENAASHIAIGRAIPGPDDDPASVERANISAVHVDFMIGGPGVRVTGRTRDGRDVEVLGADGSWGLA